MAQNVFTTPQVQQQVAEPVSAHEMFATPQPIVSRTSATDLFSSPPADDQSTVVPVEPMTRSSLPQAPKSNDSITSAAELFGAPPSSTLEANDATAGETVLVVQQTPAAEEVVKTAVELFAPAEQVVVDAGDPLNEEIDTSLPMPVAKALGEGVEPENVALAEPEAVGLDESPAAEVDQQTSAESPSKLLDDESEMLQEVSLSPTEDQE